MQEDKPVIRLLSPIPPSVNHYLSYRAIVKNGRPICTSYCTTEAKKYKKQFADYVRDAVVGQGYDLEPNKERHFYVDGYFYFPQIDMDANNYWKVMLDAITDTKLIWLDDNVVCERVQYIAYDTEQPHVDLIIRPVEYIGIFESGAQLDLFTKSNCIGCTRYERNCSVRRKAIEGRIQNGIDNCLCSFSKKKKERVRKEDSNE